MSTPASVVIPQCNYWMRVVISLELCVKEALISILHNEHNDPDYQGLPPDESALYQRMVQFKLNYQKQLKNVIKPNQWDILCPATKKSNAKDWDITLIVVVIRYVTNLPPPVGSWQQKVPSLMDHSKAAFCLLARELRNSINHGTVRNISKQLQFNDFWMRIEFILNGLYYNNMKLFKELETGNLKLYTSQIVKSLHDELVLLQESLEELETNKVDRNTARINNLRTIVDENTKEIDNVQTRTGNMCTLIDDNKNKIEDYRK